MRVHRLGCCHWLCRCPADSFEDFGSHWSRGKRFGRPKLKLHCLTHSKIRFWTNPPQTGILSDFVAFLENLEFSLFVVAGTLQVPRLDSKWLPGVFGKYSALFRRHAPGTAIENHIISRKNVTQSMAQ